MIDYKLFQAAMDFINPRDTRYWLHGIAVYSSGAIVVTGGPTLFHHGPTLDWHDEPLYVIRPSSKLPAAAFVEIGVDGAEFIGRDKNGQQLYAVPAVRVEGNFPHVQRIIPKRGEPLVPTDLFAVDTTFLARVAKVFGKRPVKVRMYGPERALTFSNGESMVVVMPCRLDS